MVKVESDLLVSMYEGYEKLKQAAEMDWSHLEIDSKFIHRNIVWILKRAVDLDDYDVCRAIIKLGVIKVRAVDERGNTPLHYAARVKCPMAMNYLFCLYNSARNFVGERGLTHFHVACASGQPEVVQAFIERGVDVNKPCSELERYPILMAGVYYMDELPDLENAMETKEIALVGGMRKLQLNALKVVQLLMKNGADTSVRDLEGRTLLWKIIVADAVALMKVCLFYGMDPNLPVDKTGGYPLHLAIVQEHFQLVELLIKYGAKMSIFKDYLPKYSLYRAVERGNEECRRIVKLIVQRGYDPNTHHENGLNLMHTAIVFRQPRMLELLLSLGADPDCPTTCDVSPLQLCFAKGHYELIEILLSYKANPNVVNGFGLPMLNAFASSGDIRMVELFVESGADLSMCDMYGQTALHSAFHYCTNLPWTLGILLEGGADPNLSDVSGKTPLHVAALTQRLDAVDLLLSYGAQPNVLDFENKTPLYYAYCVRNPHIAETLLYRGKADVNLGERFRRCRSSSTDEEDENENINEDGNENENENGNENENENGNENENENGNENENENGNENENE